MNEAQRNTTPGPMLRSRAVTLQARGAHPESEATAGLTYSRNREELTKAAAELEW